MNDQELSAELANGTKVILGDVVVFINSDNTVCRDIVRKDPDNPKRLYFWNSNFDISSYKSARRVDIKLNR